MRNFPAANQERLLEVASRLRRYAAHSLSGPEQLDEL
jgi:hypothetical protein